jgi:pyruvyltransferase
MKLFAWAMLDAQNFGDELSILIAERLLGYKPSVTRDPTDRKVLGLGSIFNFANNCDVVWGSGFRGPKWNLARPTIKAVRGPLTRNLLLSIDIPCPEVYGDPALLLPTLFPEIKRSSRFPKTAIYHFSEPRRGDVSPLEPPMKVVERIVASDLVESSTLHGIIVAEAFGIPVRWIDGKEPHFKYHDYFLSTGRGGVKPGQLLPKPSLPDLNRLIESFPKESFETSLYTA